MLGISMRVITHTYPGGAAEERDALARDWPRFLMQVLPGMPLLYLPNVGDAITGFIAGVPLSGIIFSGGEDWGLCPARDATEEALFAWAKETRLPIFGVCRGAQVINRLMGGGLKACEGHVAVRHPVTLTSRCGAVSRHDVNSFHGWSIPPEGLAPGLDALAVAEDGNVEAFASPDGRIVGVMWHPEREATPAPLDMDLLERWPGTRKRSQTLIRSR